MPAEEKAARGVRLRLLRERLRDDKVGGGPWTQDGVADRANMLRTGYVKMEGGKSAVSGGSAARIAQVYALEPADFERYLAGSITLEAALVQRAPLAADFIKKLDAYTELKKLIRKHPERWHLSSVVRALAGETYVRESENEPEVGWASLLDAIESRKIDETEERGEVAARLHEKAVGSRPAIPGYSHGAKKK